MTFRSKFLAVLLLAAATIPSSFGAEPLFGYLYTTDTLPKHKFEFEQWVTDREGQPHGYYHGVEFRTELEYGITNNLQLSFYDNYSFLAAHNNSVNHLTEGLDINPDQNPLHAMTNWHSDGQSIELLWRLLSPYTHPVGFAVYIEPAWGPRENGVEVRTIVQKDFHQDRLILTGNVWSELDEEQGTNLGAVATQGPPSFAKSKATYLEEDLGLTYRFHPGWYFGFEFRNHNEYAYWSLAAHNQQHTAFFLGPSLHYGGERWFATLTVLRQLTAVPFTSDQAAEMYDGRLYGNEHTTWDGIRLIIGRSF